MDPISSIKPAKDSTLAMLLAATRRGFELEYLELRDLWLRDGTASGRMRRLEVRDDPRQWFALGETRIERLDALDVLLMRKDPPFDTEYIYATYILERAEARGTLVVNRPQGLRDMNARFVFEIGLNGVEILLFVANASLPLFLGKMYGIH
jgi:glutathione synthase